MDNDFVEIDGRNYPRGIVMKTSISHFAKEAEAKGLRVWQETVEYENGRSYKYWNVDTGVNDKCHVLPASDDVKNSRPIGKKPKTEPSDSEDLTLRQGNTARLILELIQQQQQQITELTKGIEYLAQQVKTLVDALADEADPDAPLTTYMDGTPIR